MAPMIDMVFLLLVFFMTVSTLAKDARPEMDLALSTEAHVPAEVPVRHIISLRPKDAGALHLNMRRIEAEALRGDLKSLMEAHPVEELVLRFAPGASWVDMKGILEEVAEAGTAVMTLAAFEGGGR